MGPLRHTETAAALTNIGDPPQPLTPRCHRFRGIVPCLLGALIFGLAHTQAALYYSNQNQYFLHGLAAGGLGNLNEDWLANTEDPTPVFSAIVRLTYQHLSEELFYVYYLLLLGLYFVCLVGLYDYLTAAKGRGLQRLGFITLLIMLHAGALRLASVLLFGKDFPWYFQAGIANQYLLGPGLQPSVFGVLLLASLLAFLSNRLFLAVLCTGGAVILHATYLLPAAFLTVSYLVVLLWDGRIREAVLLALGTLFLVLPTVIYNLTVFAPSTATLFAHAQELLVEYRLPHHTRPDRWLDFIAGLQLAWIVLAIFLVRDRRLVVILLTTIAVAVMTTLVQVITDSETLALLFPWRVSAVLVPVATAVNLTRLAQWLIPRLMQQTPGAVAAFRASCFTVLGLAASAGVAIQVWGVAYRTNPDEQHLLEWVRSHRAAGEVYLLPVELPVLGSGPRGSASLSFTRPPRPQDRHVIASDFLRFRLATGAPIFVDFKSIPYKDREVLEWYRRLQFCQRFYNRPDGSAAQIQADLAGNGITHVVTTAARPLRSDALEKVYEDASYCVYRLR